MGVAPMLLAVVEIPQRVEKGSGLHDLGRPPFFNDDHGGDIAAGATTAALGLLRGDDFFFKLDLSVEEVVVSLTTWRRRWVTHITLRTEEEAMMMN